MHLQVELNASFDRADVLRVLDAAEKPIILRIMRGENSLTNRKADLVLGRSQILSLSDEARTLVLFRGELEVARLSLQLTPDRVNVVRW